MIRAFLISTVAMAFGAAYASVDAVAPPPGLLPTDVAALEVLDQQHLAIIRRAERMCAVDTGWGGIQFKGCVIGSVDNAINTGGAAQLLAYHQALPFYVRHNSRRPSHSWEAWTLRAN